MTGTFMPTTSSNTLWFDENMEDCLTSHIEGIEDDVAALETSKANLVHTHSTYADLDHEHTEYALTAHTHSGYATENHTHTGFAPSTHSHSEYALAADVNDLEEKVGDTTVASQIGTAIASKADLNHTHIEYATAEHTHSGFALENHEHTGYAATSHSHTNYASSTHIHSYDDLEDKPTIPTSLPANGGNADTVDGKHASDFAMVSDVTALQTLVGDTSVSTQISAAVAPKANAVHTHAIADVTGLAAELDSKYEKPSTGIAKTDLASDVQASLSKADTAIQSLFGYATESYVDTKVAGLVDSAPDTLNTLNELATALGDDPNFATTIATQIGGKVDKVDGKELSSNDYTNAEKTKLAGIATGANKTVVDSALSSSSTNPVQNKVINSALDGKADADHVHNVFSSLTELGITTFPTTMKLVSEAMPKNSMIVIDTRRINGTGTDYGTETISDWGTTLNGVALIMKGVSTARVAMQILYGTTGATDAQLVYGNYAHDADRVNWDDLDEQLDSKVDKISKYSAVDLNTLTKSGLYYVSDETTALHCPAGSNGHILVMSDGTRVRQVFFRVGTVDTNSWQWYSRHLGSDLTVGDNGWSKWWLLSGTEKVWNGGTVLNSEINIGSRYGCQSWIVVARLQNTGAMASIVIPRHFLTNDTDLYKFQIADETAYISFFIYYKSDNNVYLKVIDQTDSEYTTLKYVYRMS